MKTILGIIGSVVLLGAAFGAEPKTPEYLYQKALNLEVNKSDYKGAISIYEAIIEECEHNAAFAAESLYRLGVCYEKSGDAAKAGECARKLVGQYAAAVSNSAELAAWVKRYAQPDEDAAINEKVMQRLNSIVIPSLDFRQAYIADVIKYLCKQIINIDTNSPPGSQGVSILLKLKPPDKPAPAPTTNGVDEVHPDTAGTPLVTLSLRNVVLLDAIKYITSIAELKYRIESGRVVMTPKDMLDGEVITKTYRIQPSLWELVKPTAATTTNEPPAVPDDAVKKFFMDAGVPFPEGTSIKYRPSLNQLIVANTAENHEKLEEVLSPDVICSQVKMQVDHIEVTDPDIAQRFQRKCPTAEELRRLPFEAYRVRSSLSVITKSGAEAEAKSVIATDGSQTNEAFGAVLRCTPVVGPDGYTIDLTLMWDSSALVRANPPLIGRMSLTQSLALWDGEAIAMPVQSPGGAEVAWKAKAVAGAHYLIIAPTLVDLAGRRINKEPGVAPPGSFPR